MPKGYAEAATVLLNSLKDVCDWQDGDRVSHMEVKDFDHEGAIVRGLATSEDIKAGTAVMTFPQRLRVTSEDMNADRFQGLKVDPYDYNRNALWLAEKRAEMRTGQSDPKAGKLLNAYWHAWLRELPQPEDYKRDGLPLSAPTEELKAFEKLPEVSEISRWVSNKRDQLHTAVDYYNTHRGDHPEILMEDAIWGQTVVITRSFLCDGTTMAPVGDMLSHAENGNIEFRCTQDGMLRFTAVHDVKAGEELTTSYHSNQAPKDMLMQYGMLPGGPTTTKFSDEDCAVLQKANLDSSAGPTTALVNKLIGMSCGAPPSPPETAQEGTAVIVGSTKAAAEAAVGEAGEAAAADAVGAAVGTALKAAQLVTATAGPTALPFGFGESAAAILSMNCSNNAQICLTRKGTRCSSSMTCRVARDFL